MRSGLAAARVGAVNPWVPGGAASLGQEGQADAHALERGFVLLPDRSQRRAQQNTVMDIVRGEGCPMAQLTAHLHVAGHRFEGLWRQAQLALPLKLFAPEGGYLAPAAALAQIEQRACPQRSSPERRAART
jgi:hypothetical protein